MSVKKPFNFKEAKLGPNFAQDKLKDFQELIQNSQSFTVLSMPGVGVSYFLKFLVTRNFARFFYVDLYSLPFLTQHEFFKLLLKQLTGKEAPTSDRQILAECRKALEKIAQEQEKIVIVFSRFDQLKKEFTAEFFAVLQSLTSVAPLKTSLIFTSIKPLYEIAPEAVAGGNLPFYSKTLYFKPFGPRDIKELLRLEAQFPNFPANLDKLIELCGGHIQLLHILLNSQKQQNLSLDQFVKMQMKELVSYLDYGQRKQIQKIVLGKKVNEVDEYLLGVGMVRQSAQSTSEVKKMRLHLGGEKFELFTPLLTEYIKTNMPVKLPVKEAKLFKLLKASIGKTVSKDEIFTEVWGKDSEEASDWALDALIYRLRKHPFMKAQNFVIESHKKVGYTLIQP